MGELLGKLIVASIPFLIPGYLVVSWLVNHKVTGNGSSGKPPKESKKEESKESLSDSSMTK